MYKRIILLLLLSMASCKAPTISAKEAGKQEIKKLGANPYFEINDEAVDQDAFVKLDQNDVASLSIIYNKDATDLFGEKAKDGAVTVLTKSYAKTKFQSNFKAFSDAYTKLLTNYKDDEIQYILNKRILTSDYEGTLALIEGRLLKSINIIDSVKLRKKYDITDKKVGVVIKAKKPKSLFNGEEKF